MTQCPKRKLLSVLEKRKNQHLYVFTKREGFRGHTVSISIENGLCRGIMDASVSIEVFDIFKTYPNLVSQRSSPSSCNTSNLDKGES